jgi:uncharacterized membrane protein
MKPGVFIEALNDKAIAAAITQAENRTSGEIRVFVSNKAAKDVVKDAERQFLRLGMANTELRNGVLIYFAPKSRSFAVLGDKGVHEKCGTTFWRDVTDRMTPLLKEHCFTEAIVQAVQEIGELLRKEFPWTKGDRNELPNDVARDDSEES